MDRQPVLEGERLLLRPYAEADFEPLFDVAADPLLWQLHPAHDRWQEPVFRAFMADAIPLGGTLVAVNKANDSIIGSSRFQKHDPARSQVEIGWTFLARSHWGGECNREMKRLMLTHALKFVDRVVFHIGEGNVRSRRACEKIGGHLTDQTEMVDVGGALTPYVIYEITREDFARGPLAA